MAHPLQPNYVLMNQGLQQFSSEISKLANLPQVGLQEVLHTIQTLGASLRADIKGVEDRLSIRLQGVENRLQGVENRVQGVAGRLQGVENRLQGVENRVQGVENRLQGVEAGFQGIENRLQGVETGLQGVQASVEGLQRQTKYRFVLL